MSDKNNQDQSSWDWREILARNDRSLAYIARDQSLAWMDIDDGMAYLERIANAEPLIEPNCPSSL